MFVRNSIGDKFAALRNIYVKQKGTNVLRTILIAFLVCVTTGAAAKDRVLTLVAGFPPGGPSTIVARHMADALEKELGVTVIVENKPGASGLIAAEHVKRQSPDGNTLMVMASTSSVRVEPDGSLVPIGRISRFDFVFAVHKNAKASSFKEYISRVSAGEVKGDYTTPGAGSVPHLFVEQLAVDAAKHAARPARLPLVHACHHSD